MSYFAQLRDIIGDKKAVKVIAKLGGKNIRIRTKLGHIKVTYVEKKAAYDKLTIKAAAKKLGCSWRYVKRLRVMLGNKSPQKIH